MMYMNYARRRTERSSWERTDHTALKNFILGLLTVISIPTLFIIAMKLSEI